MAETDIYKIKLGSDTYNLPFLPLSGGTMSGNIILGGGNAIIGSGNSIPSKFKDAAGINPEVHSVWLAAVGTGSNNAAGTEASGILFDGNTIKMWSPLDNSPLIIDSDNGAEHTLLHSGNITKDHVGLGNVENTALSTWAGSSNLTTCNQGVFGSIITKNSGDYLSITGGTLSGQLFTQYSTNNSTIVPSSSSLIIGHSPNKAGHTGYHTGIGFNALCYGSYINHNHAWIGLGKYTTTASAECYPLVFATNESTTTNTSPIERMSIAPDGNVNIKKNLSVDGSLTVNGSNVLTDITSTMVTAALGYTPYNSTNPNGYITSSGSITGNAATSTYASRLGDLSAYHTKATIDAAINGKWAWNAADVAGVKVNNATYADSAGSAPASDVHDWAKASAKPSYSFGEIGAGIATIGDGANRLMFRTHESYRNGMYYSTPGNEALVFATKNPVTSWIFATTDPNSHVAWNGLTPSLQIKNQRVTINKLIGEATNADYNLDVNGSANATTLYENGTRVALDGHNHDSRYYTETEIDTKLSGKSDTGHTHTWANINTCIEAGNEFNFVPSGYSQQYVWFNYAPKDSRTGLTTTISEYKMANGNSAGGFANLRAKGFIKNGKDDNDVLLAGGGSKALSDFSMAHSHPYASTTHSHTKSEITDFPTSLPANGGNADTVGGKGISDFTRFYLSPMTSGAPADSAKSWFTDTMPSGSGAIVYNVPGAEKTIIAGKSSGAFGHMLQLNYDDNYLRILRYYSGSWKTTDWEKISAGYADSAGSATDQTARNAAATAQATADGKWTYNASTIAGVKVNNAVYADSAGSATKATQDSDGNAINTTYLKLSGGTMTGCITTPGDDSVVIKPAKNNYDQVGSSNYKFWKIFATTFFGNLTGNVTGNVTGNCSGSSGSCTGNAATATSSTYASRLGDSSAYHTKATIDTALAGKADSTHGTHVSSGAQIWAGVKTFSSAPVFSAGFTSSSNVTVTGKVSATQGFYEESDERLKSFKDPIKVDLEKLSKLRKSYFTFNSDPDNLQIGVSAQEIQSLYPEIVAENENGNLTVAYDKLSVIALAAVDQLSEENTKLKQQNEEILKRLEKIEKLLSI